MAESPLDFGMRSWVPMAYFSFSSLGMEIQQFTLDINNEHEIDKLCASFNNEPANKTANVYRYISENDFYHDLMVQHYLELINR
jgi:hypothetical protein